MSGFEEMGADLTSLLSTLERETVERCALLLRTSANTPHPIEKGELLMSPESRGVLLLAAMEKCRNRRPKK